MAPPLIQALAPARHAHCQKYKPQAHSSHSLIPQPWLWLLPFTRMLQDQTATKEISSLQTCREYVIRLRCNIQRSLRNSQSLLKMLCLQAPHSNHRHSQADGEMGEALLRALFQRERSSHPSTRSHRTSAHHGGVGCYTNTGRTRQGYRELNLRQSSWEWWHPPDLIRHCKTTLLQPLHDTLCQCCSEGGVPSTRHEKWQDRHPVQKERR